MFICLEPKLFNSSSSSEDDEASESSMGPTGA